MTAGTEMERDSDWKKFVKKHWGIVAVSAMAVGLVLVGAVYVFWWSTGDAQAIGLVPSTLGLFTMNNLVMFILHLLFWELVLIGIPVAVAAVLGWRWWKRLPVEEKPRRVFGRRSRSGNAGGGISIFLLIAFAIKVYVDGNWNVAISRWTLDYVVGSIITILAWIVAIFAIPATIAIIWWIRHELNRKP